MGTIQVLEIKQYEHDTNELFLRRNTFNPEQSPFINMIGDPECPRAMRTECQTREINTIYLSADVPSGIEYIRYAVVGEVDLYYKIIEATLKCGQGMSQMKIDHLEKRLKRYNEKIKYSSIWQRIWKKKLIKLLEGEKNSI